MYDVNEILARLQKGEKPEAIAEEFANAINDAVALDKKNKEAELQKAKEEAAAKEAKLDSYINDMVVAMTNYIKAAYPTVAELMDESDFVDASEIRKMLDVSVKAAIASLQLAEALTSKHTATEFTGFKTPASKATGTPDDAINQFLKNFGL